MTLTIAADRVVLRDDGATVTAPGECTRRDEHEVSCPAGRIEQSFGTGRFYLAVVRALDGPDVVRAAGTGGDVQLAGGPGDDTLTGAGGADLLDGGAGDDTVAGGAGADEVVDAGAPGETDRYDGGADGGDRLRHDGRTPWRVDLAAGTASNGAETDTVAGFERVDGGAGDDVLLGSDAPDTLAGHGGADRLDGRGGADLLLPSVTRDFGDFYADIGSWPDGKVDRVAGGPGTDVVQGPDPVDRVEGCERLGSELDPIGLEPGLRLAGRAVVVRVVSISSSPMTLVRVLGRSRGRTVVIARGTPRRTGRVALPITAAGRRLLARSAHPPVTVEAATDRDADGSAPIQRLGFRARL